MRALPNVCPGTAKIIVVGHIVHYVEYFRELIPLDSVADVSLLRSLTFGSPRSWPVTVSYGSGSFSSSAPWCYQNDVMKSYFYTLPSLSRGKVCIVENIFGISYYCNNRFRSTREVKIVFVNNRWKMRRIRIRIKILCIRDIRTSSSDQHIGKDKTNVWISPAKGAKIYNGVWDFRVIRLNYATV